MTDVRIIVASHKPYRMPEDEMYVPLQCGAAGKPDLPGFVRDDSGDNISEKNASYCELTGMYWAWKNVSADYIGLAHYRRHFRGGGKGDKFSRILSKAEAEKLLRGCGVLLPARRRYFIESNRSQYVHAHHAEGLETAERVIAELYPDYSEAFAAVMKRTSGHRFNMLIMRRDLFCSYCEWLFGVLGETEKRLDISGWSPAETRVFGYLGERLLDVWLEHGNIKYRDVPYMFTEKQHMARKIAAFIRRKLSAGRRSDE